MPGRTTARGRRDRATVPPLMYVGARYRKENTQVIVVDTPVTTAQTRERTAHDFIPETRPP